MKQGQLSPARRQREVLCSPGGFTRWPYSPVYASMGTAVQSRGLFYWVGLCVGSILSVGWAVVSFPFRLVIGIIGLAGRLVGISLGFVLMVVGVALWAGPLFILGIPLFLVGLLLTLRCLS